jgi:trk system potassium uptake protein TrkH
VASKWFVLVRAYGQHVSAYRSYTVVLSVLAVAGLLGRGERLGRVLLEIGDHPARLMLLSFGLTALLGSLVLMLPASLRRLGEASFVDALFMATSAVCVTGLAVHDVGTTYTGFGQAAILVLIQAGGLGIMALSTFFVIVAGRRLRLRSTAVLAETLDVESLASVKRSVLRLVGVTFVFEAAGAVLLFLAFAGAPGQADPASPGRAWSAVFHAVSAFCNAGFSLFPQSLTAYAADLPVNLVIMALVLAGGIGFPVLDELMRRSTTILSGARPPRLSLHARTALSVSGALVAALFALVAALEWERSLAHLSWPHKLLASLFQSVSARTAGFNTVDFGSMRAATLLAFGVAMFIGASPGSTGGGIKTTTLAALVAMLRAVVLGQRNPRLFDRTLGDTLAQRAVAVTVMSGAIVVVLGFALLTLEAHAPERLVFEALSAFGTVGLSTGITPGLTATGKLVVSFTMLAGRIGPLTMALAFAGRRRAEPRLEAPQERVFIG